MFRFQCGHCSSTLQVRDDTAGKRGRCPHCRALNVVPFPREEGSIPIGRIVEPPPRTGGSANDVSGRPAASSRPATPLDAGAGPHGGGRAGHAPAAAGGAGGEDDLAALAGAASQDEPPAATDADLASLDTITTTGRSARSARGRTGAPRRGGRARGSARSVAVGCGVMLLLTLLVPWGTRMVEDLDRERVYAQPVFSWNLLADAGSMWWVFLVGTWLIGLLVLIFSATLAHLPRAVAYLSCGGAGLLLAMGLALAGLEQVDLFLPTAQTVWVVVSVAWLLSVAAALTGLHLRGHLGRGPGTRAAVAVTCGLMGALTVALLIGGVVAFAGVSGPSGALTLWFLGGALVAALLIVAAVLAVLDVSARRGHYVAQSLLCAYLGVVGLVLWLMIGAVLDRGEGTAILPLLNFIIFSIGACLALVTVGTVTLVVDLSRGEPLEPPTRGAGASGIESKLREVQQMYRQGTISHEEYQQLRQRILTRV